MNLVAPTFVIYAPALLVRLIVHPAPDSEWKSSLTPCIRYRNIVVSEISKFKLEYMPSTPNIVKYTELSTHCTEVRVVT